jgi:hypothetical protein
MALSWNESKNEPKGLRAVGIATVARVSAGYAKTKALLK